MASDLPDNVAPDAAGHHAFFADRWLPSLLPLYLQPDAYAHYRPPFERLGALVAGPLDQLARSADRHPPVLHARDRFGRDLEWIEYHPSYREMERLAFVELGLHAMSHRAGVLGWPAPAPAVAKYTFQYLFAQAEFGLLCPVSVSDTSIHLLRRYGGAELVERFVPRMTSQDPERLWKGTQFITERSGGSDVGAIETRARRHGDAWLLHGEKWFCSHADADVALLLARPEGAPAGTGGLALFALPRHLADGARNRYRIVRLKDKMGTRSMASGEIVLDGALAHPVGELHRGMRQMLDQVNLSRLSHGVRAAGMMRRCLHEALAVARARRAFGRRLIEMPQVRRDLLRIALPAEQALSMTLFAAEVMDRGGAGRPLLRLLTPLIKYRACRDNLAVATRAMEVRGGNGYIEDWVNARLVRDAQIGVLWEGTSNIVATDAVVRAVGKDQAHRALAEELGARLRQAAAGGGLPAALGERLSSALDAACRLAERAAAEPSGVACRGAAGALYHATSAALMAGEAARLSGADRDARRHLAERVLDLRLSPHDPLAFDDRLEAPADPGLLSDYAARFAAG